MDHILVQGNKLDAGWYGPSPEEAPTLIFLHEGLGCVEMWKDFPARLGTATGCGVLVYSRLGYGKSGPCPLPRPLTYMQNEGLYTLPKIISALGIRECLLIGHSDGGSIAVVYAGGTPALPLRGLITEAAHVFCEEISVRSIQEAGENYLHKDLREKLKKYHGPNTDVAFWGWNKAWLDPDFMNWNIEEFLAGIRVPLLAIQGKEDQYGTMAQIQAIETQAGGGVEVLVVDQCRHSPHLDQEELVIEAMKRFILKAIGKRDQICS
ncbi:MAG: alpha/beta hydrolase [Deltaproteobacteria bacterium]|nr:alpha/beta hydrolase [Deltaproteobacteria bacterium]